MFCQLGFGSTNIEPETTLERTFALLVAFMALGIFSTLLGTITSHTALLNKSMEDRYFSMKNQMYWNCTYFWVALFNFASFFFLAISRPKIVSNVSNTRKLNVTAVNTSRVTWGEATSLSTAEAVSFASSYLWRVVPTCLSLGFEIFHVEWRNLSQQRYQRVCRLIIFKLIESIESDYPFDIETSVNIKIDIFVHEGYEVLLIPFSRMPSPRSVSRTCVGIEERSRLGKFCGAVGIVIYTFAPGVPQIWIRHGTNAPRCI